jgi:plastocyanin
VIRRFLLPLAALAALAAAPLTTTACGGADDRAAAAVHTTHVSMAKSYRFDPHRIEIDAGQTVTWSNDDNFTHTVDVDGQPDHEVSPGESVSIVFDKPGTYHYVCTLHSHDMDGDVIVR